MIAATTEKVRATRIGPIELGSRWRMTMRKFDAPTARDASMNSRSLSASTWPRTMRATVIQPKMASRKMMKRIDVRSPMIGVSQLISPSMLRVTSRATRNGKARKMSVTRIITSSKQPAAHARRRRRRQCR